MKNNEKIERRPDRHPPRVLIQNRESHGFPKLRVLVPRPHLPVVAGVAAATNDAPEVPPATTTPAPVRARCQRIAPVIGASVGSGRFAAAQARRFAAAKGPREV